MLIYVFPNAYNRLRYLYNKMIKLYMDEINAFLDDTFPTGTLFQKSKIWVIMDEVIHFKVEKNWIGFYA